jgi:hypothetical protein
MSRFEFLENSFRSGRESLWLNRRLARLLDLSDTPEPPSRQQNRTSKSSAKLCKMAQVVFVPSMQSPVLAFCSQTTHLVQSAFW